MTAMECEMPFAHVRRGHLQYLFRRLTITGYVQVIVTVSSTR